MRPKKDYQLNCRIITPVRIISKAVFGSATKTSSHIWMSPLENKPRASRDRALSHYTPKHQHCTTRGNMSASYGAPPETAYVLMQPFGMPTEGSEKWAVSFEKSSSEYLSAAISVAFTMIFPCQCPFPFSRLARGQARECG